MTGTCCSFVQHEWLSTYLLFGDTEVGTNDTAAIRELVPAFMETISQVQVLRMTATFMIITISYSSVS